MPDARGAPTFEEYVAVRRGVLLRTAYLLTGSLPDAEDLLQQALADVLPRWGQVAERAEPHVRAALARASLRREPATPTPGPPGPAYDGVLADAAGPGDPDREALRAALAALPAKERAVVVLHHVEELSERDTARALGIPAGSVAALARDGLARLAAATG